MEHHPTRVLIAPHDCYLILTSKCNLRCLHCYGAYGEPQTSQNELSGTEWIKILDEMEHLGVFFVNIAGGEPTMHPDFPEIIRHIQKIGLYYILTTNGLCSESTKKAILETQEALIGLKISLDGPTPLSHGVLRVGCDLKPRDVFFQKTLETIRFFSQHKVPFTIATCLHQGNIKLMDPFVDLIKQINPVSWYISTVAPTGRAKLHPEIFIHDTAVPSSFWKELREKCAKASINVKFIDMPSAQAPAAKRFMYECPAATWFCEINSDGLVTPCPLARANIPPDILKFENIREKGLKDIWDGPAFTTFRQWRTNGCDGCSLRTKCGRCIAQSVQWFKDPLMPPPSCITNAKRLGLKHSEDLQEQLKIACKRLERENFYE